MRGIKIIIFDSEAGTTREERFSHSPIKIGRHPRNDLPLNFGFVSSWHAEVEIDGRGGGSFRDIGSTNGSVVGGRRLDPQARVPVREGLSVTIGRLELRFAFEEVSGLAPNLVEAGRAAAHGGPTRVPRQPTQPIQAVPDTGEHAQMPRPATQQAPTMQQPPSMQGPPSMQQPPSMQGPPSMQQPPSMRPPTMQPPSMQGPPGMQGPPSMHNMQGPPSLLQGPPSLDQGPPSLLQGPPSLEPPRIDIGMAPPPMQEPPPPPKPKVSGAEATGFVDLGGVHRSMKELRPSYEAYASARKLFQDQVDQALAKLPASTRDTALAFFRREFPEMPGATPFAAPTTAPNSAADDSGTINQFARAVLGNVAVPASSEEEVAFLARVAEILQTSAQAFVEIRNVQSRFGEEMGVRTIREYTPLHGAADARGVLDYLLDWRRGGPERNAQLSAVYSDFMLHQVALINGVVEGVQGLLDQLKPSEVERGVGGLNKSGASWKKYTERYAELIEERGIQAMVFGPEFARAYAEVGGPG